MLWKKRKLGKGIILGGNNGEQADRSEKTGPHCVDSVRGMHKGLAVGRRVGLHGKAAGGITFHVNLLWNEMKSEIRMKSEVMGKRDCNTTEATAPPERNGGGGRE